jgi:DNA-directed RNA polymerase
MSYDGGFYLLDTDLLNSNMGHHTPEHERPISSSHLTSINRVQATPWRINQFILDTLMDAVSDEDSLGGVIHTGQTRAMPDKVPDSVWEGLTKQARGEIKYNLSKIHSHNAIAQSHFADCLSNIHIAHSLAHHPEIYYPHNFDFRLRMYPITGYGPSPQGSDFSKSLLHFANGKELGPIGYYWLAIRLANCAGQDKLKLKDRAAWTHENHDDIIRSAEDPRGHLWWASSDHDDPLMLLATCYEWKMAHDLANPETFISHLPVAQDGSINGCQHLSLLGRDPIGALNTNCTSSPERYDLYQDVADRVSELVSSDAVSGDSLAHEWVGKVNRKTVKRAVMTTPYGVTARGIAEQLKNDGAVPEDTADGNKSATYLQQKITDALSASLNKGREIMAYFQAVAGELAQEDVPLSWKIPTGSTVTQAYTHSVRVRVATVTGTLQLNTFDKEAGLNVKKCSLGAAPNVIHSLDAAMLANCVNRMWDSGIKDLHMIHDSYGCHACDVTTMRHHIRHTAFDQYSGDWLSEFHDNVLSYAPSTVDLPDPPTQGDFDISEVLGSEFFFS